MKILFFILLLTSGCKFNCSFELSPNSKQFILVPMGESELPPSPSKFPDARAGVK